MGPSNIVISDDIIDSEREIWFLSVKKSYKPYGTHNGVDVDHNP